MEDRQNRNIVGDLVADGTPLLIFTGLSLVLSGLFALFLCASGDLLPQDSAFLGMTASQLCGYYDGRVFDFMIHDRAAFGGSIISVGSIYMWMAYYPLRDGEVWAWWLFVVSGVLGFGSFLAYLGYGYLDKWHGIATLALLPIFVLGLFASARKFKYSRHSVRCLLHRQGESRTSVGEKLLLLTALGLLGAGLTILVVGSTWVFVPQDLEFMQLQPSDLDAISKRLIPLIAHDRAGFGGGLATTGLIVGVIAWCGRPTFSRWQVISLAGAVGFGTAIGIHYFVGYTDPIHLGPAWLGLITLSAGSVRHYFELRGHS